MVERVAMAIRDAMYVHPDECSGGGMELLRLYATEALEAMREPTVVMLDAAAHEEDKNECAAIYRAMIDAALSPPPPSGEGGK